MGINIKVVTTLHGTDVLNLGQEVPATMKYVLEQSDTVTAVSIDLAEQAKKIYRTKKNIQVIYNFINLDQPLIKKSNFLIRKTIAKDDEKIFVHISNFRPIKRIPDTIKVFSKVHKKIPSVLLLIGKGPEITAAKNLSKTINNKNMVENNEKPLTLDGLVKYNEEVLFPYLHVICNRSMT